MNIARPFIAASICMLLLGCGSSGGSGVANISPDDSNAVSSALVIKIGGVVGERVEGDLPEATSTGSEPALTASSRSAVASNDSTLQLSLNSSSDSAISSLLIKVIGAADFFALNVASTSKLNEAFSLDLEIPENILDGSFCVNVVAVDVAGAVSAPVDICIQVESSLDDGASPTNSNSIVGTWRNTATENDLLLFTFFADGTYVHAEVDTDDTAEISGMEWGSYFRDSATGDTTVNLGFDNNGGTGLTDFASGQGKLRTSAQGDVLTLQVDEDADGVFEEEIAFQKVAESALFGTWRNTETENDLLMFLFLQDGTYVHAEVDLNDESEPSGMEWGTYQRDVANGSTSVSLIFDNNGSTGLTDVANGEANLRLNVAGDVLTFEFDEDLNGSFDSAINFQRQN